MLTTFLSGPPSFFPNIASIFVQFIQCAKVVLQFLLIKTINHSIVIKEDVMKWVSIRSFQ